jgi:hypothetical protein
MGKHLRAIRKAVMTQENPACLPALEAGRGSEGGSNFFPARNELGRLFSVSYVGFCLFLSSG